MNQTNVNREFAGGGALNDASVNFGNLTNLLTQTSMNNAWLMRQIASKDIEIEKQRQEREIFNRLQYGKILPDVEEKTMKIADQTVFHGIVEVLYMVEHGENVTYICKATNKESRIFSIESKILYSKRILPELQRVGIDVDIFFLKTISAEIASTIISTFIREKGSEVRKIKYYAGYDSDGKYQYCKEDVASELLGLELDIPLLHRVLSQGVISAKHMESVLSAFDCFSDEVKYGLLFLMHEQFMGKFVDTPRCFIIGLNDCIASRKVADIMIPWKEKRYIPSFKKRVLNSRLQDSNDENLVIKIGSCSAYELECATEALECEKKGNINLFVLGDELPNMKAKFDKVIILDDSITVGTIPQAYYWEFVEWLHKQTKIVLSAQEDYTKTFSDWDKYIYTVVCAMLNFWESKGGQIISGAKKTIYQMVYKFFKPDDDSEVMDLSGIFVEVFKKSELLMREFDCLCTRFVDGECYCDDEFVYMNHATYKSLVDKMPVKTSDNKLCDELANSGILIRERRGGTSFYNTVKVNGIRAMKMKKSLLLTEEEELFWRDEK